jgi:hypothetical protein
MALSDYSVVEQVPIITCAGCHVSMTTMDWQDWAARHKGQMGKYVSASNVKHDIFKVTQSTVKSWMVRT